MALAAFKEVHPQRVAVPVYRYVGRLVPVPEQAFELIESTYNVITGVGVGVGVGPGEVLSENIACPELLVFLNVTPPEFELLTNCPGMLFGLY